VKNELESIHDVAARESVAAIRSPCRVSIAEPLGTDVNSLRHDGSDSLNLRAILRSLAQLERFWWPVGFWCHGSLLSRRFENINQIPQLLANLAQVRDWPHSFGVGTSGSPTGFDVAQVATVAVQAKHEVFRCRVGWLTVVFGNGVPSMKPGWVFSNRWNRNHLSTCLCKTLGCPFLLAKQEHFANGLYHDPKFPVVARLKRHLGFERPHGVTGFAVWISFCHFHPRL
jgi:hypothetical protein